MIAQGRQETPGGATDQFLIRLRRKATHKMIAQGRQETPGGATDRLLKHLNRNQYRK